LKVTSLAAFPRTEHTTRSADAGEGGGRTARARRRRRRRRLAWLSWVLIVVGLLLILTPLLQRAYSEIVQARLRAALEQEIAASEGAPRPSEVTVDSGLVGLAGQVFDALDPIFNRIDDDPTLGPADEGISLPTRETFAGVSRIIIEKAGVDAIVVDGTSVRQLRQGPGFYPQGSLPHLGGNVAIAGHRTTYGAWFRHLDRLREGDLIQLVYRGEIYNYEVEWIREIAHNDWSVIAPTEEHVLTLTTCHPPGSAEFRLAVRARWVGTSQLPRSGVR